MTEAANHRGLESSEMQKTASVAESLNKSGDWVKGDMCVEDHG